MPRLQSIVCVGISLAIDDAMFEVADSAAQCTQLRKVNFSSQHYTDRRDNALAACVRANPSLYEIHVDCHETRVEDLADCCSLFNAIAENYSRCKVKIRGNPPYMAYCANLQKRLTMIYRLNRLGR